MRPEPNRPLIPNYAIIGDGPTESIYFDSIKNTFRQKLSHCHIEPDFKRPVNIKELDNLIDTCRKKRKYKRILCIIDMDTKLRNQAEMNEYQSLKQKHAKHSDIRFFETHPCSELWFYYHFALTTQPLDTYEPSVKNLIRTKIRDYDKKVPYCTYSHIQKCGGTLENAITNGRLSMKSKVSDSRDWTYSDMARFFEEIGLIPHEIPKRRIGKKK